jgi:predicted lipoprotein with Yx(FWY)xxD motif
MKWMLGLAVAALGLGLTACGSDSPAVKSGGVADGQPAAAATVTVADNPAQGSILVDGQGHTLYLFEQDKGTTSACTGACAPVWPALTAAAQPTAGTGADASLLGTASGQVAQQVTYGGHLLYTYSRDAAPGDVKGVGIPGWYPVSPSGAKVDKDDDSGKLGY